jgi:opacity protein-like surface antigen
MRKLALLVAATATLSAVALSPTAADAGCYRFGETGYHWYNFCAGPGFLYPHQRVCRNGYCWYR